MGRANSAIAPDLIAELHGSPWMYEWALAPGVVTPTFAPILGEIHATRAELVEPPIRHALERAGPSAVAIDLACNEGWFSHRLLDWGASRVVGVDIRESNVHRAELVRDHFGIPEERLQFRCQDVLDLDREELGSFDVVVMLGLVYHLENPGGAMRVARALTRDLCVIETQLTRQRRPIVHGFGNPNLLQQSAGSFAVMSEPDSDRNPLASAEGLVSLIPNRAALEQLTGAAGFSSHEWAVAAPDHELQYVQGDRGILFARVRDTAVHIVETDDRVDSGPRDGRAIEQFGETVAALVPPALRGGGGRSLDLGPGMGRSLAGLDLEFELAEPDGGPALAFKDGSFELVTAYAVLSHLVDDWSRWLCELHRTLADGGLVIASFLGQGAARGEPLIPAWDEEETGMLVLRAGAEPERGGPTIYHSAWWIREHWGRAFEPLRIQREGLRPGPGGGEGVVMMRKRGATPSPEDLERIDPEDLRELAAWRTQLAVLRAEEAERAAEREETVRRLELEVDGAHRSFERARELAQQERAATLAVENELAARADGQAH